MGARRSPHSGKKAGAPTRVAGDGPQPRAPQSPARETPWGGPAVRGAAPCRRPWGLKCSWRPGAGPVGSGCSSV